MKVNKLVFVFGVFAILANSFAFMSCDHNKNKSNQSVYASLKAEAQALKAESATLENATDDKRQAYMEKIRAFSEKVNKAYGDKQITEAQFKDIIGIFGIS